MCWIDNDDWQYTEEQTDARDVLALFEFLALPIVVGVELDLD